MSFFIEIYFMDGKVQSIEVPEGESWHICKDRPTLIIGHKLTRVEVPLCNIRMFTFEENTTDDWHGMTDEALRQLQEDLTSKQADAGATSS